MIMFAHFQRWPAHQGNGHDFRQVPRSAAAIALAYGPHSQGFVLQGPPTPQTPPPAGPSGRARRAPQAGAAEAAAATPRQRSSPRTAPAATAPTLAGGRAPSLFDDSGPGAPTTRASPGTSRTAFRRRKWRRSRERSPSSRSGSSSPTSGRRPRRSRAARYVPDPDGQVIKSEKQTFKIEIVARGTRDAVGPRVPA